MDSDPHFSEEEVRRILARAARKQEQAGHSDSEEGYSLSLTRLQEVAAEAGISPAHVENAAREVLLHREQPAPASVLGLPRELRSDRFVPGRPTDAQWERMVSEFRQIFGRTGIPSQYGEIREWVSSADSAEGMPVIVRLEPAQGGTRITIRQSVGSLATTTLAVGGSFSGAALIFGLLQAAGMLDPGAGSFAMLLLVLSVLTAVIGWGAGRAWTNGQRRAVERAADRAELVLRSGAPELNSDSAPSQLPAPPALP